MIIVAFFCAQHPVDLCLKLWMAPLNLVVYLSLIFSDTLLIICRGYGGSDTCSRL